MDRPQTSHLIRTLRQGGAAIALTALVLPGCASLAGSLLTPRIDPVAATLAPGDFALDTEHAALLFRIDHLGFSDYVGRFDVFKASLSGDAASPEAARIEAIIDMRSLNIANPDFAAELMGPGWFDAEAHPQAIFRSRSVTQTSETTAQIDGDLTLRGVTQPILLETTLRGSAYDRLRGADVVGFSARGEISRAAFGIDRYSGLLTDSVRIEIEAEFIRLSPD
ncbi:MAG: YceI family protein [Hyphomonas sp.]